MSRQVQKKDSSVHYGQEVAALRAKLGVTQEEFAHELDITVSSVNRWENGRVTPSPLAIHAMNDLADRYEVPRPNFSTTKH